LGALFSCSSASQSALGRNLGKGYGNKVFISPLFLSPNFS
jgi:hypothetical protein